MFKVKKKTNEGYKILAEANYPLHLYDQCVEKGLLKKLKYGNVDTEVFNSILNENKDMDIQVVLSIQGINNDFIYDAEITDFFLHVDDHPDFMVNGSDYLLFKTFDEIICNIRTIIYDYLNEKFNDNKFIRNKHLQMFIKQGGNFWSNDPEEFIRDDEIFLTLIEIVNEYCNYIINNIDDIITEHKEGKPLEDIIEGYVKSDLEDNEDTILSLTQVKRYLEKRDLYN